MVQELMVLEQLFGRGNSVWLSATLLMGLLLVLIFRPNAIQRPILFRVTCWLLALLVVIPPILTLLLSIGTSNMYSGRGMGYGGSDLPYFMACANLSGPVLQAACIVCGLAALTPPMTRHEAPTGLAKHPLDQS
jgi:hypothetical protein